MKLERAREEYTICCTRNERIGLPWFKTGIWNLRGMWKEFEKERVCVEGETMEFWKEEVEGTTSGEKITYF
jgi:hypothetical protein